MDNDPRKQKISDDAAEEIERQDAEFERSAGGVRKFLAYMLIVSGILITFTAGLCTLIVAVSSLMGGSAMNNLSGFFSVLTIGAVPIIIGIFLYKSGSWLKNK